jgi:hypothetical protein
MDEVLSRLLDEVDTRRLMTHINEFARWTKHAGTFEELESLRYIEREIASYGYEVNLIQHEAYISLPGMARIELQGEALPCITHSFSRSSPDGGISAPLVSVGDGTASDYAGRNVTGCIVLIDGIANPPAALEASRHGVVGQIHISADERPHEMCISPVWGSPGDDDLDCLPKTVVVTVGSAEGARIKQALASRTDVGATLAAEIDTGWRQTPILVADLPARRIGDAAPFILFTGHHDAWYYGVMDNGGANATMLEVSRLCAQYHDQWQRGLRVIFWSGHSQGRYSSSAWYADNHWEELHDRALVHVNVDSTGGKGNTIVADTTASAELFPLASEIISALTDQTFSERRMDRAGDQSFWGIGIPSIFCNMSEQPAEDGGTNASAAVFGTDARLGNGTGWWWHTPEDTADKIEEEILLRDTRIYLYAVWKLIAEPTLPLDFERYGQTVLQRLEELQCAVGDRFDLTLLQKRAEEMRRTAGEFNQLVECGNLSAARANSALLALSHILTPIEYTEGDRFRHDRALAQESLPAIGDLPTLAKLDPDSDHFKALVARMVRERNRIAFGLREAVCTLHGVISETGE